MILQCFDYACGLRTAHGSKMAEELSQAEIPGVAEGSTELPSRKLLAFAR